MCEEWCNKLRNGLILSEPELEDLCQKVNDKETPNIGNRSLCGRKQHGELLGTSQGGG